ncbi:hypothetical protein ACN47E_002267 [Coniothyrium glycines]
MGSHQVRVPFGKKELRALYKTYGDDDLYSSGRFRPQTQNLTTGKIAQKGHHCEVCNAAMTKACYDRLHHAYCPTWVTRQQDGILVRMRCGERFALHSDGCGKHPRVQGYNRPLYEAANGQDISIEDFQDPDPHNGIFDQGDDEEASKAVIEEAVHALDERVETMIANGEYVPPDYHSVYFVDTAKEAKKDRKKAKQRSLSTVTEDDVQDIALAGRGQMTVLANGRSMASSRKSKRRSTMTHGATAALPNRQLPVKGLDHGTTNTATMTGKERVQRWAESHLRRRQ